MQLPPGSMQLRVYNYVTIHGNDDSWLLKPAIAAPIPATALSLLLELVHVTPYFFWQFMFSRALNIGLRFIRVI
jgi:hypothetical protein